MKLKVRGTTFRDVGRAKIPVFVVIGIPDDNSERRNQWQEILMGHGLQGHPQGTIESVDLEAADHELSAMGLGSSVSLLPPCPTLFC